MGLILFFCSFRLVGGVDTEQKMRERLLISNGGMNIAGSLDYEDADAESFADWGVDYLKYDNCYHMGRFGTPLISFNRFNAMAEAIKKTGRSILYSLCSWGEDYVHTVSQSRKLYSPHAYAHQCEENQNKKRRKNKSKANYALFPVAQRLVGRIHCQFMAHLG